MAKTELLIQVQGGVIIFIAATEDCNVRILDHDLDEIKIATYEPDRIMDTTEMEKYADQEINNHKNSN